MTYYNGDESYNENDYARDLYIAEHDKSSVERTMADLRVRHYAHGRNPLNPYPDKNSEAEMFMDMIKFLFLTIGGFALAILLIYILTCIF